MHLGHVLTEFGRGVPAETSLAEAGADVAHDDSRSSKGEQRCEMADCEVFHELGQLVPGNLAVSSNPNRRSCPEVAYDIK
jgi:hypothetical protein